MSAMGPIVEWAIGILVASVILRIALLLITPKPLPLTGTETSFLTPSSEKRIPLKNISEPSSLDLSIVIPAFNESTRLPIMLREALSHLTAPSTPKRSCEIIIVDDGSKDSTTNVALQFPAQTPEFFELSQNSIQGQSPKKGKIELRVLKFETNRGKGGAVRAGVLGARGKRILMVDADGASRFGDLENLWKDLDTLVAKESVGNGSAVAIGSRAHLVGTAAVVKRSIIRNFLMHSFHFILRTLGVGYIRDTQCGFKLFTRKAASILFPPLHIYGWLFDVEILLLAQYHSIPVVEVPVGWHEVEGSKLSIVTASIAMLRDLLVLRANYALGFWKVYDAEQQRDIRY